jgi:hypothetical protein
MRGTTITVGLIKKVDLQGLTLEEWCKNHLYPNGINEEQSKGINFIDLFEMTTDDYLLANNILYEIKIISKFNDEGFEVNSTENGELFVCACDNGSTDYVEYLMNYLENETIS